MTQYTCEFFQCDNPGCQLRFPIPETGTKPKRCPICRSSVHVESTCTGQYEAERKPEFDSAWNIEVLLDNIRSAWNVGAILRTSDGLGIRKVYCCGITPSLDHVQVSKTALGAETSITWESCRNGVALVKLLKSKGYSIWALEGTIEATSLYFVDSIAGSSPTALVVGNENCGVDPGILALSDKVISIPMLGNKKSFNVAVAFGIAVSFLYYRHSVSQESLRILPKT
jgi:23S rRNA (guanosine2251-2'-O)-methyltransferase